MGGAKEHVEFVGFELSPLGDVAECAAIDALRPVMIKQPLSGLVRARELMPTWLITVEFFGIQAARLISGGRGSQWIN